MSTDTILIIDGDLQSCDLLRKDLEGKYKLIINHDIADINSALSQHHIALILLDMSLSNQGVLKFCQQIKTDESFSHIPVILLANRNEFKDETEGLSAGADDFIFKPINPAIAKARISTHLNLAKTQTLLNQHVNELDKLVAQRTVELTREIAEKQKVYERLHYLANYDQLTQLPNRNLFNERLSYTFQLAHRNKTIFALLLIDLDRFKFVNDSLGHHIGDLLLEQVGNRLSKCLRGVDTVARLGGDEFTVTLTELKQKEDAAIVANKIIAEISRPFEILEHTIHIGSSIGITSYPDDGDNLKTMLKNADMAMYAVKSKGKNAYKFFSPDMTIHANHRMELEKDLHSALENNELYIHYQPITDLENQSICGVEALIRWQHPEHGIVPAEKIISIAEESDLILKLGEWILIKACKQMSLWLEMGFHNLHMAINISTRQFDGKYNTVELIKKLIEQYQIPKYSLQLEITESLMLEDSKSVLYTLFELKELGVLLSVDDFGTGYSSLSYLRRFPIDILKIDQSFISDLNLGSGDDTLVKAIIAMSQSLNLKVIAEGVETREQLTFLQNHDCDFSQGYYFSKPIPAKEIEALLTDKVNFFK